MIISDGEFLDLLRIALHDGDANTLTVLVPSISVSEANYYIAAWNNIYLNILNCVRNGGNITVLNGEEYMLLNYLLEEARISSLHR